ncbi:amidase [Alkalicaulis satelles]|uniref:Amidase n=1 Tax=Alkalicaulis satelles TaxID=2609175 RepID=A0A5M6ZLI1_9PROT|nr:amidase [Alkalicaulis satelles]KAA5804547.1 amidase [Alkalicaulis satelles]
MSPATNDLPLKASQRTWAAQAAAFALGRWSPLDVFDAYAQRIARINPALNAVLDTRFTAAREEAGASADRWARGAPLSEIDGAVVLVKANIAVEGLPWHAGIKAYERRIARDDAACVARLKAAGAIIAGTVNMEEAALGAVTDNPWFGRTLNPWGKAGDALTPGGSSGGSGAAVAAGLCVMALGTDTMGSVRIPAAYCGVSGHKPGRGLVETGGVMALSTTLDHVGPLTRSARDLSAFLAALSGQPQRPQKGLTGLTIGRWRFEDELTCDPDVMAAFEIALARLDNAGARIVDVTPSHYAYGRSRRAGLLISEIEGARAHAAQLAETPEGFSEGLRKLLGWGAAQSADKVEAAYQLVRASETDAQDWFAQCDLVVSPVALEPAFAFGAPVPAGQADLTAFAAMAGLPATAAPMGLTPAGLPCAIQFMAPQGRDGLALRAASQFEMLAGGPLIPPGY